MPFYLIRPIQPQDNRTVKYLVQSVLAEFGCTGPGFASSDPELEDMYTAYQSADSGYWVVVDSETQAVMGGCGFSRLKGTTRDEAICELQKFYFFPPLRGQGIGKTLLQSVMQAAQAAGYSRMYLETLPQMIKAQGMYAQVGFQTLPHHLGNTGHQERCTLYMARHLLPATNTEPTVSISF